MAVFLVDRGRCEEIATEGRDALDALGRGGKTSWGG